MKMIKLSEEHYIVVDDSEIKEGDWIGFPNLKKFVPVQYLGGDLTGGEKKITHSTQPLEWFGGEIIFLSEVKELVGVVDKAFERYPVIENDKDHNDRNYYRRSAYYQALEDNKDKKYTEDDLKKAICIAKDSMGVDNDGETCYSHLSTEQIIQSLQPTEWEVEFVDGKLKLKQ